MVEIAWHDERLTLLPERAVWWARRRTLLVADMHLGKAATFRALGVPVPQGPDHADLARLSALIARLHADRLVILGDLLHAKAAHEPETLASLDAWRATHRSLNVLLIRGNHDTSAGDPPAHLNFVLRNQPASEPDDAPLCFAHHDHVCPQPSRSGVFCGHIHPRLHMRGPVSALRAPCFWLTQNRLVLPAFGTFTGGHTISPGPRDRVFPIGDDRVIEIKPQHAATRTSELSTRSPRV